MSPGFFASLTFVTVSEVCIPIFTEHLTATSPLRAEVVAVSQVRVILLPTVVKAAAVNGTDVGEKCIWGQK